MLPLSVLQFIEFEASSLINQTVGMGATNGLELPESERDLVAEYQFIREWNLDKNFFNGVIVSKAFSRWDNYKLESPKLLEPGNVTSQLDVIHVGGDIRFGNSFMALLNALMVAKVLNVKRVQCNHPDTFTDVTKVIDGITVSTNIDKNSVALSGKFFSFKLIKPFFSDIEYGAWWESPYRANSELLQLYGVNADQQPLDEGEIVIHIRSGDIFEIEKPHPHYAQPPLSYYLEILKSRNWAKVWLVYEDISNPVIPALEDWLRNNRIEFEVSSGDIPTDINLCMRAQNLALSYGSFLYPVISGSKNLRRLYRFRPATAYIRNQMWFTNPDAELHCYTDEKGKYTSAVVNKWRNSKRQRRLMLKYPAQHLKHQVFYPSTSQNE